MTKQKVGIKATTGEADRAQELINAAIDQDLDKIRELVEGGLDVDAKNNNALSALIVAADKSCNKSIQLLLELGADPNTVEQDGFTPLYLCAFEGNIKGVEMLFGKGAGTSLYGAMPPLHCASAKGHKKIVELLLSKWAKIDLQDAEGNTALIYACKNGHSKIVRLLVQAGANLEIENKHGDTALFHASEKNHLDVIRILLENGANPNHKGSDERPAIFFPVSYQSKEAIDFFVTHGADIELKNSYNNSALVVAILNNHYESIKYLLDAGADPNAPNRSGHTPLHMAINSGNIIATKQLLASGGDPNQVNEHGEDAATLAILNSKPEVLKLLIEEGVNVNYSKSGNEKNLDIAIYFDKIRKNNIKEELVLILLKAGCDSDRVFKDRVLKSKFAKLPGLSLPLIALSKKVIKYTEMLLKLDYGIDGFEMTPEQAQLFASEYGEVIISRYISLLTQGCISFSQGTVLRTLKHNQMLKEYVPISLVNNIAESFRHANEALEIALWQILYWAGIAASPATLSESINWTRHFKSCQKSDEEEEEDDPQYEIEENNNKVSSSVKFSPDILNSYLIVSRDHPIYQLFLEYCIGKIADEQSFTKLVFLKVSSELLVSAMYQNEQLAKEIKMLTKLPILGAINKRLQSAVKLYEEGCKDKNLFVKTMIAEHHKQIIAMQQKVEQVERVEQENKELKVMMQKMMDHFELDFTATDGDSEETELMGSDS